MQILTSDGQRIDGFVGFYLDGDGNAVPMSPAGTGSGGAVSASKPAVLQPGIQLTDTAAPIVTAEALTVVTRAVFSNATADDITITVHRVPAGGTPSPANQILSRPVAPICPDRAPELAGMVLEVGATIQVSASADGIVAFVSGLA